MRKKKEDALLLQGFRSWLAKEGTTDSTKAYFALKFPATHTALLPRTS